MRKIYVYMECGMRLLAFHWCRDPEAGKALAMEEARKVGHKPVRAEAVLCEA